MPTPVSAQGPSQPPPQDAPIHNGSALESSNISSSITDNSSSQSEQRDAIWAGKEKAKAVMEASGVNVASQPSVISPPHTRRDESPGDGAPMANGSSSRKRSRSGSRIPSKHTEKDKEPSLQEYLLHQYIERDSLHAAAMNDQAEISRNRMFFKRAEREYYLGTMRKQKFEDPGSVFGYGYLGYGNGLTEQRPARLEYPEKKKRPGSRRARAMHISRKDKEQQAEQLEELVPIRLDIDFDNKIRLRDTFTWNLHDRITRPEVFAENLVEDFRVPRELALPVAQRVLFEMTEQIQDFYPHIYIDEDALDPHLPYHAYKNDEMRILIKLNITIGQHTLMDQFEWELNNPSNSPEEFASLTARELSLSGEFATAIAHSIREQCQIYTKSLYITGHPFDGRPIEDADVRDALLPSPLPSVFRLSVHAKDYTPYLYELNETELERTEHSMLREQRRQKRSVNRRGGPVLPDLKDRQRTVRTLIVSSVLPGAAENLDGSRLYKVVRSSGRKRVTGRLDGGDDSDESEESDSAPESPAPSQLVGGTARTRGMRGAASAAQAAMRANLGRSATPEIATLHHHETRTSRRSGLPEREESIAETLVVKLHIGREAMRSLQQGKRIHTASASTPRMPQRASSQRSTPAASGMLPPPSPAMKQQPSPQQRGADDSNNNPPSQSVQYSADGRVEAPYPLPANYTPPPPPPWLVSSLRALQSRYKEDSFEATMRWSAVDKTTGASQKLELAQGAPVPPNIKHQFLPRIRCNDCPGKLYTAGPELTLDNFEIHLKNRGHRSKVDERKRR
ncbi:SNF5-domain-containing protein [Pseudovirgaria hyperparasitica]|uniref:SNF5-domain-containing protein n=1 Tax=Pseudovirgaria hyperparasitica TaxID=470096 RepID=A0A6A6WDT6_9PEZI|nr:SNF5-domain-containing protein [Pseudovirgaria hyperparasitica]KAF2760006.1 SNF5-domain-containing protein [Pseudovirgaria hyperparasitica]